MTHSVSLEHLQTPTLDIAYEASGPANGEPVVLLHGFPYDPRAYDDVVPPLVAAGCRTLVPYLRGYGPTRFRDPQTPRSGQQAALGKDLLDFMDALGLEPATLVGYDWGGRAACVVAALWPARVRGLVTQGGYNIQNIGASEQRSSTLDQEPQLLVPVRLSTPSAVAPGSPRIAASFAASSGACGRQPGIFPQPPTNAPPHLSTIRTLSRSSSTRTATGSAIVSGDPAYAQIEAKLAAQPPVSAPTLAPARRRRRRPPARGHRPASRSVQRPVSARGGARRRPQPAPGKARCRRRRRASARGSLMLVRDLEELTLNAWPALTNVLYDGWVLSFSKRLYAARQLDPPALPIDAPAGGQDRVLRAASTPRAAEPVCKPHQSGPGSGAATGSGPPGVTPVCRSKRSGGRSQRDRDVRRQPPSVGRSNVRPGR